MPLYSYGIGGNPGYVLGLHPGAIALLFIVCPPVITALATEPSITFAEIEPAIMALSTEPELVTEDLEPLLTALGIEPTIDAKECC